MAYQLKTIRYKNSTCQILLQNENGPCPLLAAVNCLLLKSAITLPAHCVRNSVASLQVVVNLLANQAMTYTHHDDEHPDAAAVTKDDDDEQLPDAAASSEQLEAEAVTRQSHNMFLDELLQVLPKLQYGMDVNPKFTEGITGYEYTSELSAFDMLRVKLVHGWLMDPAADEALFNAMNKKSYNQVVELIIQGKDAEHQLSAVHKKIDDAKSLRQVPVDLLDDSNDQAGASSLNIQDLEEQYAALQQQAHCAAIIEAFLHETSHQLTQTGLSVLHETLQEGELDVFFRNNHFGTLAKHEGSLYLLVTDLGYSHTPDIVWEKLDMIDGDTELVNSQFARGAVATELLPTGQALSPDQLMAQSGQKDADYHLAMQLSMQSNNGQAATTAATTAAAATAAANSQQTTSLDQQEGQLMAAATAASLREYHGIPDSKPAAAVPVIAAATNGATVAVLPPGVEMGVPMGPPSMEISTASAPASGGGDGGTRVSLPPSSNASTHDDTDRLLAMQLQANQETHEDASLRLAQSLQAQENQRAAAAPPPRGRAQRTPARAQSGSGGTGNCVIS